MTCGNCGCLITPELQRKKSGLTFIYYHCTNGKGNCDKVKYLRQETIDVAFANALQQIQLPQEIVERTRQTLLEDSHEERAFRETTIQGLTERYKRLDRHIGDSYEDKLEGRIEPDLWQSKTAQWKKEQIDILAQVEALNRANTSYLQEGVRLMELASRAAELFKTMTTEEKREMLGLVLSNPKMVGRTIEYDYKMPYKMFVGVTDMKKWLAR